MKTFPTREPLFPTVLLSPEQAQRFTELAHAVVHDTVAEYDHFVHRQQRKVNKRRWKRVKSRENIAVYKERDHDASTSVHRGIVSSLERTSSAPIGLTTATNTTTRQHKSSDAPRPPRAASAPSSPAALLEHFPAHEYNLPKLLMVGTISGTLDDVLYGLSTHDSSSILLRSVYTQDEIVDGQIVHQIEGPTPHDPFRFLGIKWIIKRHPPAVSAVVAPRDVLFLNSVGTLERAGGERLGYFFMHSIDLPAAVPSLYKSHGIVRARLSTCHVFRQVRDGCVEVYMKGYVEPSGKVVESVALSSAVSGLLFCWKSVVCAQAKKIVWLLQQEQQSLQRTRRRTRAQSAADASGAPPVRASTSGSDACGLCERSLSVFNSAVECELCDRTVCSRCRVAMKLCFETAGVKLVEQRSVVLCKCCITRAHRLDTRQVAQDEVRSGRFGTIAFIDEGDEESEGYSAPTSIASDASTDPSSAVWDQSMRLEAVAGDSSTPVKAKASTTGSHADVIDLLDRDEPVCEWNSSIESPTAASLDGLESPVSGAHSPTERWMSPDAVELWTRMAQLKMRQEDVYQFAKQNASLVEWSSGVATSLDLADLAERDQRPRESID